MDSGILASTDKNQQQRLLARTLLFIALHCNAPPLLPALSTVPQNPLTALHSLRANGIQSYLLRCIYIHAELLTSLLSCSFPFFSQAFITVRPFFTLCIHSSTFSLQYFRSLVDFPFILIYCCLPSSHFPLFLASWVIVRLFLSLDRHSKSGSSSCIWPLNTFLSDQSCRASHFACRH